MDWSCPVCGKNPCCCAAELARPETCRECRFYRDKRHGLDPIEGEGRCRRYPPLSDRSSHEAKFPIVLATYWCGEFVPNG